MDHSAFATHGALSWCELMTPDVDGAKRFYGELLGWTLEPFNDTGMPYTVVKAGDRPIGGIMATPPEAAGMPPAWGIYITVNDVDALAGRVAALGGKLLVPPTDIPTIGRFAVVQDPAGACLSLITYLNPGDCEQ